MSHILEEILNINFENTISLLEQNLINNKNEIDYIKSDYKNFSDSNIEIKFKMNNRNFCKAFKEHSKNMFTNLSHITEDKYDKNICKRFKKEFGTLTFKEAFVLNYYRENTPRCCFCGAILPISFKIYKKKNLYNYTNIKYVNAQIEHIFPQSKFPQFIFHMHNLIPICQTCNSIKRDRFFNTKKQFYKSLSTYGIDYKKMHPFKLYKYIKFSNSTIFSGKYFNNSKLFKFYNLEKRGKVILDRCYSILFNIIRNSDIRSPESLEKLLENMASSSWHEINDGYSLNNSPQIWQEFLENILYDECKLMALWDEVKSSELRFL